LIADPLPFTFRASGLPRKLMIRNVFLTLLLAIAAVPAELAAQALPSETMDRIVAIVEEDVILQSELDRAVNNILAQYAGRSAQLPPRDVIERQVLERLILIRLQLQRAESTGIRISDTELDQAVTRLAQQNGATLDQLRGSLERDGFSWEEFRKTMRDEMIVQRMRQRFVQSRVNVTDTEVEILLASGGLKRGEVRLSHILVAVPDGATPEQIRSARDKVELVGKELSGGLDFGAAAIRYSDGQQALEGGDLGWRRYDEVPSAFVDLIATLKPGEVTQPMRGPSGFHILKLVDTREESRQMVREYNARHILIKTTELVSSSEALASVRNLRDRIIAGEDFAVLAREFSEDTTSANLGGDMGWFEIGAYGTRVAQELETLADSDVSQPFQTEVGWHIVQRLGTREQDRTDERLREQARDTLRNRKAEEEWENFTRQLRNESYVENRLAPEQEGAS
jgi:peptidyl-prolyl cis-trans isomerase SurA